MNVIRYIKDRSIELTKRKKDLTNEISSIEKELKEIEQVNIYLHNNVIVKFCDEILERYLLNIEAYCNWAKVDGNDPDERFMREIESKIAISENSKKAFREEILIRKNSYRRKDKSFTYTSNERLGEAIYKYVIER